MSVDRRARGWRILGVAAVLAAACASVAHAASGGTGAAGSARRAQRVAHKAQSNPFATRGMWIWYVSASNGGNLSSIISQARRYGIGTLTIKSGDGTGVWSQFSASLVRTLHASGIHVCGWQYVYGNHPIVEAQVGAAAVHDGADCLVIDAESEYEGRYVQAQTYITRLRRLVGGGFPVALASFPYVDYHPGFPYSIFLGPGGAQYDTPQMYWVDIGTSVDAVYSHSYAYNRIYQRQLDPLGQVYNHPPPGQVVRFRELSRAYGARGVSWWDWQEATGTAWRAISQPAGPLAGYAASASVATIRRGWQGDLVVWAQEHLISAGYKIRVDGGYGPQTQAAVRQFQTAHGLSADGVIGSATWQLLLRYGPARVQWTAGGARVASVRQAAGRLTLPVPKSASLPAKRDEIPRDLGAGPPRR
jgi:Putative peptidoglycan binding domain